MGWGGIRREHETHGHTVVRARSPESGWKMRIRDWDRGSRWRVEPLGWQFGGEMNRVGNTCVDAPLAEEATF